EQLARTTAHDPSERHAAIEASEHFEHLRPFNASNAVEMCARLMRCPRVGCGREQRRLHDLLPRLRRAGDCVDARPNLEPDPPPEQALDLALRETRLKRLSPRDQAALPPGDLV